MAHNMTTRRMTCISSKATYSKSVRSETKEKEKKPTKGRKNLRTKNTERNSEQPKDVEGFTLVNAITIKDKKTYLRQRIRPVKEPEVPSLRRSVRKSKTTKAPLKAKHDCTEGRARTKYLNGDFKVPASNLKTRSKPIRRDVPPSFLSSLSVAEAGSPCHPDALIYRKSFKKKKAQLVKELFTLYNREIFGNQLPAELVIDWNTRMTTTSGYCYNKRTFFFPDLRIVRSSRLEFSTKIIDRAARLRDTMIHELCHAATWVIDGVKDGHGPRWRSWAKVANRKFPELPKIKRCHTYEIEKKYTYKCAGCGYCIARHSKSLNVTRKRCGYCYGVFELFLTSKLRGRRNRGR